MVLILNSDFKSYSQNYENGYYFTVKIICSIFCEFDIMKTRHKVCSMLAFIHPFALDFSDLCNLKLHTHICISNLTGLKYQILEILFLKCCHQLKIVIKFQTKDFLSRLRFAISLLVSPRAALLSKNLHLKATTKTASSKRRKRVRH